MRFPPDMNLHWSVAAACLPDRVTESQPKMDGGGGSAIYGVGADGSATVGNPAFRADSFDRSCGRNQDRSGVHRGTVRRGGAIGGVIDCGTRIGDDDTLRSSV